MADVLFPQRNIVILGAGFGGLTATRVLGRALKRDAALRRQYDVVLVDRNDAHAFTPGLYEVATTLREDIAPITLKHSAAIPIEEGLRGLPIRFIQDEVTTIDAEERSVKLRDGGILQAEYLILALGAVTNDFGISGVAVNSFSLKTFHDALRIRSAITTLLAENPDAHVLIAGGGATGVELAGELTGLAQHVRKRHLRNVNPQFTIVEAGPRLLRGAPDHIATKALKRLKRLGVVIRLNTRIVKVTKGAATVTTSVKETEKVPFDLLIWSGGIKPPALLTGIVVPKNNKGLCLVDANLTVQGAENLFAIGDITCFINPKDEKPVPATAYVAMGQGKVAARNVLARISGQRLKHYRPPTRPPFVVPISGKWALAYMWPVTLSGFPAFLIRLAIDLRYFVITLGLLRGLRFFIRSTIVYFRND